MMARMTDDQWMQVAIDEARRGIAAGQTPFGAVIVRGDELVAGAHNVVWRETDATAHAEMTAIRMACRALHSISLSGCRIYTTCEPCPMCLAASHWAGLDELYYGAEIADAKGAGFNELTIPCEKMKELGQSRIKIVSGILSEECRGLFAEWSARPDRRQY
jgi:tRNA(Arg) A34 adenosine deaminase TadA